MTSPLQVPVSRAAVPSRKFGHIPAFDGLRAVAAILVVFQHLPSLGLISYFPPHAGTFGVIIFFVLSGFLMGHLYLFKPFDSAAVLHYISARLARVIPLFYTVVIFSFVFSKIVGKTFIYYLDNHTLLRELTLTGSSYVFWSIPPEIEFYFVFLIPWWLYSRRHVKTSAPLLMICLGIICAANPLFPGITVFSKLHIFLIGIMVASIRQTIELTPSALRCALIAQISGILLILFVVLGLLPVQTSHVGAGWEYGQVYSSVPMAIAFGGLVLSFAIETPFANYILGNRVMRQLGAYSFSIYLLHEPVITGLLAILRITSMPLLVQDALAGFSVVAVAAVSFHWYEMPAQTFVRRMIVFSARAIIHSNRAALLKLTRAQTQSAG